MRARYSGEGDRVVVVGGNSGIGTALIEQLLSIRVEVISIDIQETSNLPASDHLKYNCANPTSRSEMESIITELKDAKLEISGLVNLSGTIAYFGSIEKATAEEWNHTYNISFQSCLNSCQLFAPLLKENGNASIVNMSSGLAFIGQSNYGPYSAAKAAVVSLTKTLAVELGPHVRVNSLAPGAVDTPFIYKPDGTTRFDKEGYKSSVPLGNIGQASEIAAVILFLLSDGASHITGECIHVNGGAG